MNAELPNTYFISPDQHKFYDDNGYLVIKGLLDFASLYNYKRRFIQICKGQVDKGSMTVVKEHVLKNTGVTGEDLINKVQDIHYDDVFSTYTEHPRLLHVLAQFIGGDIDVVHSMFINKPPGSVSHPPHQDLFYFPFRPAEKIIAAWTAVDDVTVDNGCLYVIPKSHKRNELYDHGKCNEAYKLYHGIAAPEPTRAPRAPLQMAPGDTVLFHPLLVHGSGPNHSKRYRKSITAHYASAHVHYVSASGTQRALAEEIEQEGQRRGFKLTFEEAWKYRSKPVQRIQSKL